MTTYVPWSNPVQHPHLVSQSRPSLKRKHSYYTSASSEVASSSPTDYSPTSDVSDLPTFADSADTTIDASQGSYRPHIKRRRYETLGVEGDFDDLALERNLSRALREDNSGRETPAERLERFWELDGEIEVDMVSDGYSASSILHPSSFHSPVEQRSTSEPLTGRSNWYEPEKDRECLVYLYALADWRGSRLK
jgi:hypothetical protein